MNRFRKTVWIVFCLSIVLQAVYALSVTAYSQDADTYLRIAYSDYLAGRGFYPTAEYLYQPYICPPGWINLMIWIFTLGGNVETIYLLNVVFSAGTGILLYKLAERFVSQRAAALTLLIYALYPHWIISVNVANTELPYVFFGLLGFYLCTRPRWPYALAGGLMLVAANWMRPFLPILIAGGLFLIFLFRQKRGVRSAAFLTGLAVGIVVIGSVTCKHLGHFEYQATTMPINLLMTARDGGGGFGDMEAPGQPGYIENADRLTYKEKNRIWMERAVGWIKEHPLEFAAHIPQNAVRIYLTDTFFFTTHGDSYYFSATLRSFPHWDAYQWLMLVNHIYYYLILALAAAGVWLAVKARNRFLFFCILYVVLGTGASSLAAPINRYHTVLMPFIILLAAYAFDALRERRRKQSADPSHERTV